MKVYLVHRGYDNLMDYDSHMEDDIVVKAFDTREKAVDYVAHDSVPTEKVYFDGTKGKAKVVTEDMSVVEDGEWEGYDFARMLYVEFGKYDKTLWLWNIEEMEVE